MRQLSIRSKILLTFLLTGLASLAAGGIIGYRSGFQTLTDSVDRQLSSQRENKRQRVYFYVVNQLRLVDEVGGAPETIEAAKALITAFRDMHADLQANPANEQSDTRVLEAWYTNVFLPQVDKIAGSHTPLEGLMPADPVARRLQADYIARNPNPVGQKDQLVAAPGNSRYDAAHARYHAALKRAAQTVGFYDINLMDAATGDVVYTVAKETDFGSNMYHGPFVRSGFANVAQRALDPKNGGKAVIEDFTAYMPSAFAPQMFAAVPIIDNGQTIGVFVAQIDIATLSNLLTDGNGWQRTGQGETGEVQLVGEDRLLRTQSRFMATQPDRFLTQAQANGLPSSVADQIRTLGTTILYMPDHNASVELAFHNQTGVSRFVDARGVEVVAAYGPLEVAGIRWAIQAKQDVAEAFAPVARLTRDLLVAAALASIVLTFLALVFASMFVRPLRRVITAMRSVNTGGDAAPLGIEGDDEFADLARGYNTMAATIGERDRAAIAAEHKAVTLLRSLYPAALAERMSSGAEVTAETVVNVTVVFTSMDGLDALAVNRTANEMAEVLNTLLDAMNGVAASHGVEPVRSLGESHIAVCGLSSPRLDHAMRALAWSQDAVLAVRRLNTDWAQSIALRFGLASGEVDVLLLKRGHAAYDIWGRTLSIARRIALDLEPGWVGVSESTYSLLTKVEGFETGATIVTPVLGTLLTWRRPAVSRVPDGSADKADAGPRIHAAE
jgi:class 3 adenylate cyclase